MPYLLDTDLVIEVLEPNPEAIEFIARLAPEPIHMSAITLMEAYEGTVRAAVAEGARDRLLALAGHLVFRPFGGPEAIECARLRAELRARGRRVDSRSHDLMIAATALAHGLTVVTRNVRDYADLGVQLLPYT